MKISCKYVFDKHRSWLENTFQFNNLGLHVYFFNEECYIMNNLDLHVYFFNRVYYT